MIDLLETTEKSYQATITQVALAWTLAQPAITATIIGANSVDQLNDILGSVAVKLSPQDLQAIDEASAWK